MARPAPKTNFYINYGAVTTAVNTDALTPVFIAPRYAVHASAYGNAALVDSSGNPVVYSGASLASTYDWPATSGGAVDTAGAVLIANGATVVIGNGGTSKTKTEALPISGAATTSAGGAVTVDFGSGAAIAGPNTILTLGYQLRGGDQLRFTSGSVTSDYQVTDIEQSTQAATCTITGSGAVLSADMSGFTAQTDVAYLMTITSAGASSITANIVGVIGDTSYSAAGVELTSGTAEEVGNYHLQVTLTSVGTAAAGQSYQLYCTAEGQGDYTKAVLAASTTIAPETIQVLTNNLVTAPSAVSENGWAASANGIALLNNASLNFAGASLKIALCQDFYVNYRELLSEGADTLLSGSAATLQSWVGPLVEDNPLGMIYAAATGVGNTNFYLMSVAADTDEGYKTALQIAAKTEAAYALFPLRQTNEVISYAQGLLAHYSQPSISQVKRLWLYSQVEQREAILESTATEPILATISGNTLTLASGSFATVPLKYGSQAVFTNVYSAENGTIPSLTVTITAKTSDTTATIAEQGVSITTPAYVTLYNQLSASEYAEAIAAKARSYNNHRINFIFAEANTTAGTDAPDARYITPVLMAMRAAVAPHAPLTDLAIPGVSISDSVGFQDTDYETMNDAGVWICYRNRRGEMVTRHAITTGKAGTIAEEDSAVSNGDNILRFIRNSVAFLNGSCNVTPALINTLTTTVYNAFDRIVGRVYSNLIGPQILSIDNIDVHQDPNNSAGVIGVFDLDLPDVYLDGEFTFNLF